MKPLFFLALAASATLALSARADVTPLSTSHTIDDAIKLATDTNKYNLDVGSGASTAQIASDSAAVNADFSTIAADAGISSSSIKVGGHVININIGGGALASVAFPSRVGGVSIAGGGGGGLLLDVSFGSNPDGSDHYHLTLNAGINSLTYTTAASGSVPQSTTTEPAWAIAIMPSYKASATAPQYGGGPVVECPTNGSKCVFGIAFSTGFTVAVPHLQFNV